MPELWTFFVVTFVSIFTMIDPLGNIPVFIAPDGWPESA